ncbi:Exocyst complex component 1 [Trichinella patagoniensis]|uniref:Exocyst complex component 1 n=1 Tax=Trichinella patagoniensis TaxID=990121 RepID=A0A0V1AE04_9BILA|nr:Exocyst complex component 1 [Trichinella patagoniensis]
MDLSVKQFIQREVFEEIDERIITFISVFSSSKKKKRSFLCVTISYFHPVTLRLHELRMSDKGKQLTMLHSWLFKEIKLIDGINPRKSIPELEITTDKTYRWEICNVNEKESFIRQMWKVCHRHLASHKPEFVNISIPVEEMECRISQESESFAGTTSNLDNKEEFHTISPLEENDFKNLLSKYNMSIADAQNILLSQFKDGKFIFQTNMQAIVGSERQIAELLNQLDLLLSDSIKIEETLDTYDRLLAHVQQGVEMMEEKDMLFNVYSTNRIRLMDELTNFLTCLDLSNADFSVLSACNLSDPKKILECTRAAMNLQKCIDAVVSPGMEQMVAYQEQMQLFTQLQDKFSEHFVAHLTGVFRAVVNEAKSFQDELTMPKHDVTYGLLKPFSELILWLKTSVPRGYFIILKRYADVRREVNRTEMGKFVSDLQVRMSKIFCSQSNTPSSVQSTDLLKMLKSYSSVSSTFHETFPIFSISAKEKQEMNEVITLAFSRIEEEIAIEEKFCSWFFHISGPHTLRPKHVAEFQQNEQYFQGFDPNDLIRSLLSKIYSSVDELFQSFLDYFESKNPLLTVYLLSALTDRALSNENGSYAASVTGKIIVHLKRRFDSFMKVNSKSFCISKSTKKIKYGILPALTKFLLFAQEIELAYENRERRSDVDRWYPNFVNSLWDGIEVAATDPNGKSPASIVRMENYHVLHSILSQLKIACLVSMRKETKEKYFAAMNAYVKEIMGKPFEKLQIFFDNVSRFIDQGMKAEDISYQQAFNRQELRRIVGFYPLSEVRRGIEQLYDTTEQHLSDEKHLLQVIWRNVQNEFIRQYKKYEHLINTCYPNSNIQMEFSLDDLLSCLSEIARQH